MSALLAMEDSWDESADPNELSVSFGYQCNAEPDGCKFSIGDGIVIENSSLKSSTPFACLSGAALSANATLANTNICNGLIGEEILPSLDSPKSFRRMASSPSLSRLDLALSSSHGSMTSLSGSSPIDNEYPGSERTNIFTRTESSSFLIAMDVQMAGGAAGEDRVQAVCSEDNGWLFCGIYDGFNGRDAADFLAGTLYEKIALYLHSLDLSKKKQQGTFIEGNCLGSDIFLEVGAGHSHPGREETTISYDYDSQLNSGYEFPNVIDCLTRALAQAESDFMHMVEQEMEDRPDLVSVGSCVLVVLLYDDYIHVLNLGDSRAVLATKHKEKDVLKAIQLTEVHTVDNKSEYSKVLADHPDDPSPIVHGRVKGKLKLSRAFGVGYLKKSNMNDMLVGILRVQNLCSPPYVYDHPFTLSHRVSEKDQFVVLGSDGLFDFFSNDEVVQLVNLYIEQNPSGDPAKHLVEQLVKRAADNAGFRAEDLLKIPAGRRRKYHDDVTVIVVILGNKQRTSTASTSL